MAPLVYTEERLRALHWLGKRSAIAAMPRLGDTLQLDQVIQSGVSPRTALSIGLKVDVDTLPASVGLTLTAQQKADLVIYLKSL